MGKLTFETIENNGQAVIKFTGDIDEDSTMPTIDLSGIKELTFDFEQLDMINSCGIRDWVTWMKKIPTTTQVLFTKCPSILIDQVNMINGFVPEGGKITSFFVPYFCDDCDDMVPKLFNKGKEYDGESCTTEEEIECPKCNSSAEIDVIKLKYFKFLKNFG